MTIKHILYPSLVLSISVLLSSCATTMLENMHGSSPMHKKIEQRQKVFTDQILSYGIPSTPIKDHEYAIAMAGQQYSYLIEPKEAQQKTLFRDFLHKIDTQYLAFTTPQAWSEEKLQAKSIEQMLFDIKDNQIQQTLIFFYIQPTTSLKKDQQAQLEQLNFKCSTKHIEQNSYLSCQQPVAINLTVATKAQNTHQLAQYFRTPLTFNFYQVTEKNQYNVKKIILTPFYPLTITYDILSVPVIFGLAAVGIEGPASKALEGIF